MRASWIGVAIVAVVACSKKSAEVNVIERRDKAPTLAGLMLTNDEREQLEAKIATAPDDVLSLSTVTSLTADEAKSIAQFKGSAIVLEELVRIGPAEAEALAQWRGATLLLGVTRLDPATAGKLAQWPGTNLHLDHVIELDAPTASALAAWKGRTLGLARLTASPDAMAALKPFTGFVAISLTADQPKGTATGVPPAASTEAEIAVLAKMSRAVDTSDLATLREYLEGGGSPDINEQGTTLLMEAANLKQLEPAKLLIEAKANVNAMNQGGRTPLYYALDDFQVPGVPGERPHDPKVVSALVHLLVEAKAEVEPASAKGDVEKRPLGKAAKRGDVELVKYLLAKGADAKLANEDGVTALIPAINAGHAEVVTVLVAAGAPINVPSAGLGASPIFQAVSQGASDIEMARFEKKDAKTIADTVKRRVATLDAVLAAGADLSGKNDEGWTVVDEAINGGSPEILTRVLGAKPKFDEVDGAGKTPLQFLADCRRLEEKDLLPLAKLLVAKGADKKAKTADGQTAADIAASRKFAKLAAALK